jgi:hypothetical protein
MERVTHGKGIVGPLGTEAVVVLEIQVFIQVVLFRMIATLLALVHFFEKSLAFFVKDNVVVWSYHTLKVR